MRSRPTLSSERSREIARQIASALEHMHAKAIQHRDLKPANLVFAEESPSSRICVIDLGLATYRNAASRVSSGSKNTLGAQVYMSPEKARGNGYDDKDDIWALGLIMASLATGKLAEDRSGPSPVFFSMVPRNVVVFVKEAIAAEASLGGFAAAALKQRPAERSSAAALASALAGTASLPPPPPTIAEEDEGDGEEESKETIEAKLEREFKAAMAANDFDKCEMMQALIAARKEAVAALEDAKSEWRFADAKAAKAALDKLPTTLAEYLAVGPPRERGTGGAPTLMT